MFTSLIVGIVVAAASATAGAIDWALTAKGKRDQLEKDKAYLEAQRKQTLEQMELKYKQAEKEAKQNAKKAENQAELTDKQMDVSENLASEDYNNTLEGLQTQAEQDAYNWNYYAISAGQAEGEAAATAAASGVRSGSTMDQAVDMEAALNSQQLQLQENASRQNYDNQLANMGMNLQSNMLGIQGSRVQADWQRTEAANLRASYAAGEADEYGNVTKKGGSNWNIYQSNIKGVWDTYNYNADKINTEMDEYSGWKFHLRLNNALLGGSASGFQTGYNIGEAFAKYSSSATTS